MKTITVLKTLRYDPTDGGQHSVYGGYCLITEGRYDPEMIKDQRSIDINQFDKVFSSSAKRAKESVCGATEILTELNEVSFCLRKIVSKQEYEKYGSEIVRRRFLESFVKDILDEKRNQIEKRLSKLITIIRKLPDGKYLIVSHSFIMKIFEAYLHENDLFSNPGKLSCYLNPLNRTYNFGEGFEFVL